MHIKISSNGNRLKRYSSHLPILIKLISITKGPVLELGMGLYSTPFLHWSCRNDKRELVSYDNDTTYFEVNRQFEDFHHKILFADDWNTIPIERKWDIGFVDYNPIDHSRIICVKRLANYCNYIVVHDSEPKRDSFFGYSKIYHLFKYRYDYTDTTPHTSILSNFIDLNNFKVESERI